jgi:hypothetical protein
MNEKGRVEYCALEYDEKKKKKNGKSEAASRTYFKEIRGATTINTNSSQAFFEFGFFLFWKKLSHRFGPEKSHFHIHSTHTPARDSRERERLECEASFLCFFFFFFPRFS